MSERMIELARMRQQNQQAPPMITEDSSKQPPIQAAAAAMNESATTNTNSIPTTMESEEDATKTELSSMDEHDDKLHTLLYLLSERSRTSANLTTVPSPLTRRILNRQGVNYLDEHVGHLVSIAADQFLATVVSQAIACRDHRLEGEEFTRKNKRKRIKLRQAAKTNSNTKTPPPKDLLTRAKQNLVQAHHALKAAASTSSSNNPTTPSLSTITSNSTSKGSPKFGEKPKTKKEVIASLQRAVATAHANLIQMELTAAAEKKKQQHQKESHHMLQNDDEDFIDEDEDDEGEEITSNSDSEEDDEDDEQRYVIRLRDVVRPLESWGIPLTGKIGLFSNTTIPTTISENKITTDELPKSHLHDSKLNQTATTTTATHVPTTKT